MIVKSYNQGSGNDYLLDKSTVSVPKFWAIRGTY